MIYKRRATYCSLHQTRQSKQKRQQKVRRLKTKTIKMEQSLTSNDVARWLKTEPLRNGYKIPKYDNCKNPMVVKKESVNVTISSSTNSWTASIAMRWKKKNLRKIFQGELTINPRLDSEQNYLNK